MVLRVQWALRAVTATALFLFVSAECPNACSAHGKCGAYDMCRCFRNWMANDCSQRICQFGLAHVDTPKGDLDASSGELTDADTVVAVNDFVYRFGTTERYPATTDIAGNVLTNTAHEYRECSNKGICDRIEGTCICFPGYEGSACQRLSCPSSGGESCSGHGVCINAKEASRSDNNNRYMLWDDQASQGCQCDAGYSGPDCSQRLCPLGLDPLYPRDRGVRYLNFTFAIFTPSPATITGEYVLILFDGHGGEYRSSTIAFGASCSEVAFALTQHPAVAAPDGVYCTRWPDLGQMAASDEPVYTKRYGIQYTIAIPSRVEHVKEPQIDRYLDGRRSSLQSDTPGAAVQTHVYSHGYWGENVDMFDDECAGVDFSLVRERNLTSGLDYFYIGGLTALEQRLLMRCLGDADGEPSAWDRQGEVGGNAFSWDFGSLVHPHLVRIRPLYRQLSASSSSEADLEDLAAFAQTEALGLNDLCPAAMNADRGSGIQCSPAAFPTLHQPSAQSAVAPAFLSALVFDAASQRFVLLTLAGRDFSPSQLFAISGTSAVTTLTSEDVCAYTNGTSYGRTIYTRRCAPVNVTLPAELPGLRTQSQTDAWSDDISNSTSQAAGVSCENVDGLSSTVIRCVEKGDRVFLLDLTLRADDGHAGRRASYLDLYSVAMTASLEVRVDRALTASFPLTTEPGGRLYRVSPAVPSARYRETVLQSSGGPLSVEMEAFFPAVSECSNRGICDRAQGTCSCFEGYALQDCSGMDNTLQ